MFPDRPIAMLLRYRAAGPEVRLGPLISGNWSRELKQRLKETFVVFQVVKMSGSEIETWTAEQVHQWLLTEVKVHPDCADRFTEEEVMGESLVLFEKKDILDMGIKHGPAAKILCYLKTVKAGGGHQSEFPAYVETWTKEQVALWLQQHVKVYAKYADCCLKEDVSGDCLVCFSKQDFLDLGVKSGPAVKILGELRQLNTKPEPQLEPGTHQREAPKPEPSVAKPSQKQPEPQTVPPRRKELGGESRPTGRKEKETSAVEAAPAGSDITVKIQRVLGGLLEKDLKLFHFYLRGHKEPGTEPFSAGELEKKDSVDTAVLLRDRYGAAAPWVTAETLSEIGQQNLALQLEQHISQLEQQHPSRDVLRTETHQGHKLKTLLTCGGSSLDSYDRFVVVVNRSSPEQVQYLQFLSRLDLFCVLDFDPNSVCPGGLCHSYKELRVANLHTPAQFQGQTEAVIKKLNLFKQTSWIFCNGRHDLDSDPDKELDYRSWLRKRCRDVEQLVSFICSPDVFPQGRCLIIFLLLSALDSEKNPLFDTYKSFIKNTEEANIINLCHSRKTYLKWKELIQEKCDFDIDHLSIYDLSLSEINGTIMGLGPQSQASARLLPSAGSSAVVLTKKDEDLLTALDVLCLNECENVYDESSTEFKKFRVEVEEKFYRGAQVRWWNFYFCDRDKEQPFIKRDKYEPVKRMVRSQRDSKEACVLLNLYHAPSCGGTTLVKHVMWDLRHEFRCTVLKDKTLPKAEVSSQVRHLMKLESEKLCPVLLLVDDSKETDLYDLVTCIRQTVEDFTSMTVDAQNCQVIVLNCVRSQTPKDLFRQNNQTKNQFMTDKLTQQEQMDFDKKLYDLKETHEKPESFYSFMVMKSNFDKEYTRKLARDTLENFEFSSKEGRLFGFLALLNTYVAKSEMALSLCEDFFQMKVLRLPEDSVLDRMKPLSNLLIVDRVEDWGGYKGVRILHHAIASACLDELEGSYSLKASDIVMEMLHCDLFFSSGVVKHRLTLAIQRMLIERQRKKDVDERQLFSLLIDKVHSQEGRQAVQQILEEASARFETSASIPQALARYLYKYVRDFPEALKWAEKAKNVKENIFTNDTIGQVHKSNLRSNMDREKQETSHSPEDLQKNLEVAMKGMKAFHRAQELADREDEPQEEMPDDDSEDYPRNSYNYYGNVSMLEIALLVFEILSRLPFFEKHNPMKKKYLQSFLGGKIPITSVYKENSEINNKYVDIIREHHQFLVDLKSKVKELFENLNCYFTYIKVNSKFDMMNHRTVSENFKKYVELFCTTPEERREEQENKSSLNLKLDIEERKLFLERNQADTFSGILQHLDKPPEEVERITECYAFLQGKIDNQRQRTQMQINYVLSNIVLYHLKPKSKHVKKYRDLRILLNEILQDVGLNHLFPDPYYLALLLFWPSPTENNTEIPKYVSLIRKSSHKNLYKLFQRRSTIAHFYLGKEEGLKRLFSKPSLDADFLPELRRDALAQLWRNGDIFKEEAIVRRLHRVRGTTEQGEVYANYGTQKIPVRPAHIGGIRSGFSTEKVSFFIGFAINGPLAYDIKYEN
ncbi:unnamed protein product [Menidia menidia]|uniref:(Atlantic silverside) hypothetical protein n=1 Tax=Menidia menidia TaxID=238744 RepID=A0A8S4AJ96_9TELE|nr:unnamed protein product [Menidia menidia]